MRRLKIGKRYTNQEWQTLIEKSQTSSLLKLAFCQLNGVNTSRFYTKRDQLKDALKSQRFIRSEVVEKTTSYQIAHALIPNMTVMVNKIWRLF
ncbi:IS66 family insertion sequence element accessory protein TnpA [Vibrio agarilyticus]|uniref:IS66 family insertion sequence element accessory protein TnpA n=1 Tax=Vibrio agarilyticus TaxID=2726741 RepID=UPI003F6DCA42